MNFDIEDNGDGGGEIGYMINYPAILESKTISSIVKDTARTIIANPYLALGDFLKGLSNNDLQALSLMHELSVSDEECLIDLVLLTEMLSNAEGAGTNDMHEKVGNLDFLGSLFALESLSRKGIVKVYHENLSFGHDMRDAVICDPIPFGSLGSL